MRLRSLFIIGLAALASPAAAEPPRFVLRMASVAPEGTAWAREMKAFAREVDVATRGEVHVKWYLGGIAGDDLQVGQRIERGQLDGAASGGMLCQKAAPAMRVMRIPGVFSNRQEAAYVMSRLQSTFEGEFRKAGLVLLGATGLGQDVVLSRRPIATLDDLRRLRIWRWNLDEPGLLSDKALGLTAVPMPLEDGAAAYDDGKIDGFIAIPAAALAFQWFARTHYLIDLRQGFLWGCLIVATKAFDRLPSDHQQTIRTAGVKLGLRMEIIGHQQDDQLLGGLFAKQGMKALPVSESLRAEFLSAARSSRDRLGDKLVATAILQKVLAILADYRSEHR
jgi:TRAP-type transport system periplasmic protein